MPISVVIPAYNAGRYIAETIASVHSQSVAVDEILVIDDGSTDDTVSVALRCGAQVFEQSNLGVSVARNFGVNCARNEWIALLDADDLWQFDKLERQWLTLEKSPSASFSFCDFSQFDEVRVRNASVLHEVHLQFSNVKLSSLGNDAYVCDATSLSAALVVQNIIQPSALLIRKQTAIELGGFDQKLLACQDYDFVMRLTRDHIGTFVDRPLVGYRRHATATTSNIPKSREGLANVALRAIGRPWEYAPETVDHFRRILPQLFFKCGFAHFRFGSPIRARGWFRRSIRERFNLPALVLYALTYVIETRTGRHVRDFVLLSVARVKA